MLRHAAAALRSIDRALSSTGEAAVKKTLGAARSALEVLFGQGGAIPAAPPRMRRSPSDLENLGDSLLDYVRSHPGQRGEQIAQALGTDTTTMRPAMKRLIEAGKVKTEGQRRGMTYDPA